jgi:hypothetical protein
MLEFTERMARNVAIAQAQAIGYVWGVQDATKGAERDTQDSLRFGEAYGALKRAYLTEQTFMLPNIADAYALWAATGQLPIDYDERERLERSLRKEDKS